MLSSGGLLPRPSSSSMCPVVLHPVNDDDDDDDFLITQPLPRTHRAREQELWQHCTVQTPGVSVPIVRANFGHPLEVEGYLSTVDGVDYLLK